MITARLATSEDSRDLWIWRNDPVTRAMSITTEEVAWDAHTNWYEKSLSNPNRLGSLDGRLIGLADDRHMITVAGSRAGKGVSVIIPNLIFYPGSVLAIDPKGELASITARRRARDLKQKVFVLDPFERTADWVKPYRASFNPMATLTPDNPHIAPAFAALQRGNRRSGFCGNTLKINWLQSYQL